MSGYTPVFRSIFDGTLHGKWPQTGIWLALLAMTDRHGCIDRTPQAIASDIGISVEELTSCLVEFCEPDPMSRTQDREGRRLVLIEPNRSWGWRVVNHGIYREKARLQGKDAARVADGSDAERKRAERERENVSPGVPRCPPVSPSHTHTHTHTTDSNKNKSLLAAAPPTRKGVSRGSLDDDPEWLLDFKLAYPARAGDQGWRKAISAANVRTREGHTSTEFIAGARRYAAFCDAAGKTGTEYVKQAATFLGPDKAFLLPWHAPPKAENATERILRALNGNDESRVIEHEPERNPRIQGR